MSQAVKRACDACHRRKVKCDGINPCRNCSSAQLSCTYNAVPQKKGPKGSRAKVISELRETQRQTSLSAKVQNRINGIACPSAAAIAQSLAPTPGLLTSDLVKDCSHFLFDNLYAQIPILDRRTIEHQVLYMEQNRDAYCLMASMCAFTMLQPGMAMPPGDAYNLDMIPGANIVSSQLLLEEALKVRKGYEYLDSITLNSLATNFFIFSCYYSQEMHDKAWYYLREAATMAQMAGMDKEDHYLQFDAPEAARRRRLYWLLFVLERAYGIQRQKPLTLQASINLPTLNDDPTDPLAHNLHSFIMLVNLYRPFDNAFTAVWNKTRSMLSPQFISGLQKQLGDLAQTYACQDSNFSDVRTNQQWLKNTVWQLANNGSSSGNGAEDSLSFQYPMDMSRELLMNMASQFPGQGMELLGSGLIEKLIETTYSLSEFLSLQPASRDPFAMGPREHLNQIVNIVAMTRSGDYRFLPLLMNKVADVLPRTANPMLQHAPETSQIPAVDIFDGFGNAGMAHQPAAGGMQMSMDTSDYDRKFSAEEYDKQYALEMTTSTAGRLSPESSNAHHHNNSNISNATPPGNQSSDMSSSFVGSPDMMSPTAMDYPHGGMNNFSCNPLPDMMMNGGGNNQQQQQHHGMNPHQHDQRHMSMSSQGMMMRQTQQQQQQQQPRQNSFHMQASQLGADGFHNLQRSNTDNTGMVGMSSLPEFAM